MAALAALIGIPAIAYAATSAPAAQSIVLMPSAQPIALTPAARPIALAPSLQPIAVVLSAQPIAPTPSAQPIAPTRAAQPIAPTPAAQPIGLALTPAARPITLAASLQPLALAPANLAIGRRDTGEGSPQAEVMLVQRYLTDLRNGAFADAYRLLNIQARAYYRTAANFRSIYDADNYRLQHFALAGRRSAPAGAVFFVRETAQYRDLAHDLDLVVTATVPVGVIAERGGNRIKDPGHPWRAFQSGAWADRNGLRATVKKVSFFKRRIETVVSIVNSGATFITVLPYGKSLLRDNSGTPFRILESRDWTLADRALYAGLRLAPNATYTGILAFTCAPLDDRQRTFTLTLAPLLVDGADLPFALDISGITARPASASWSSRD